MKNTTPATRTALLYFLTPPDMMRRLAIWKKHIWKDCRGDY
jgi:hypothetical protein